MAWARSMPDTDTTEKPCTSRQADEKDPTASFVPVHYIEDDFNVISDNDDDENSNEMLFNQSILKKIDEPTLIHMNDEELEKVSAKTARFNNKQKSIEQMNSQIVNKNTESLSQAVVNDLEKDKLPKICINKTESNKDLNSPVYSPKVFKKAKNSKNCKNKNELNNGMCSPVLSSKSTSSGGEKISSGLVSNTGQSVNKNKFSKHIFR